MSVQRVSLSDAQRDRAIGALLGTAAGDALGAGGGLGSGMWSGVTARAVAIAEIASAGADLSGDESLDYIAERWTWWARTTAAPERTSGSGPLAWIAPAALGTLANPGLLNATVRRIGALTRDDPDTADACVLWCAAIAHAVHTGGLDVRIGLLHIDSERREVWESRLAEAEDGRPSDFDVGSVVGALQAAWFAIVTTPVPADDPASGVFSADHLRLGLDAAVRAGRDAATVGAVAGSLLGAAYGASALPWRWRLALKGWPGLNTRGLVHLGERILGGGEPDRSDQGCESRWDSPPPRRHPHDDGVFLGSAGLLARVPAGVGAVVSLCRVADGCVPDKVRHLDVRLIDQVGANANLDVVLLDTVRAVEGLRAEGATVFLHGLTRDGRTPTVAALYGARRAGVGVEQALAEVGVKLPDCEPNREFRAALRRLHPGEGQP